MNPFRTLQTPIPRTKEVIARPIRHESTGQTRSEIPARYLLLLSHSCSFFCCQALTQPPVVSPPRRAVMTP